MTVSQAINYMRASYIAKQLTKTPIEDTLVGDALNRLYRNNIKKQPGGVNVWVGAGIDLHTRKPIFVEGFENNGNLCVAYNGYILHRGKGEQSDMHELAIEALNKMAVFVVSKHTPVLEAA